MHGYGAYNHSDTLRFRSLFFKECHASSVTPYTIYYQNTDCGGVALLQLEASRADIRKYRCLALSWLHKKHLKLQSKYLVVIMLV